MSRCQAVLFYSCYLLLVVSAKYPGEEKREMGSLEGDVQNWAMLIQNYILQVTLN